MDRPNDDDFKPPAAVFARDGDDNSSISSASPSTSPPTPIVAQDPGLARLNAVLSQSGISAANPTMMGMSASLAYLAATGSGPEQVSGFLAELSMQREERRMSTPGLMSMRAPTTPAAFQQERPMSTVQPPAEPPAAAVEQRDNERRMSVHAPAAVQHPVESVQNGPALEERPANQQPGSIRALEDIGFKNKALTRRPAGLKNTALLSTAQLNSCAKPPCKFWVQGQPTSDGRTDENGERVDDTRRVMKCSGCNTAKIRQSRPLPCYGDDFVVLQTKGRHAEHCKFYGNNGEIEFSDRKCIIIKK